jgi:hypothetical protein
MQVYFFLKSTLPVFYIARDNVSAVLFHWQAYGFASATYFLPRSPVGH